MDSYLSIASNDKEGLYKEKGSKFLAYAFPVKSEDDVKVFLAQVKSNHHAARHWCYGYRIGSGSQSMERANDDGEPSNSAGAPILGQINAFDLSDVMVVVVRYYGGVKLGVGGLIQAYREAVKDVLNQVTPIDVVLYKFLKVKCSYEQMNWVLRQIKSFDLLIDEQTLELDCTYRIAVLPSKFDQVVRQFKSNHKLEVKVQD